jgi:hypothetical protein
MRRNGEASFQLARWRAFLSVLALAGVMMSVTLTSDAEERVSAR